MSLPKLSLRHGPAGEPLLDRVPTVDEFGKPLGDMLVLLPGLREKRESEIKRIVSDLHAVLELFADEVMFAELNLNRNQLWISVRPVAGIRASVAIEIRRVVSNAKLVAHL